MFFILVAGILCLFLCVAGCTENPTQEPTNGIVNPTENPTEEPTQPPIEETPVSTPEPTVEPTVEPTAEPTARVQAYDLELEVLMAGKRESANGFNPYPGKIFLLVSFKITNLGNIPYEYSAGFVVVEDENGDKWGFVEDATFQSGVLNKPFGRMTIEPRTFAGGGLIFSVPQSTQTYRLLLHDKELNMVAETEIGTVLG